MKPKPRGPAQADQPRQEFTIRLCDNGSVWFETTRARSEEDAINRLQRRHPEADLQAVVWIKP